MKSQLYLPLHPLYLRIRLKGRVITPDPDLHHLQEVNGVWCVRASIDRGPKLVADRVKESLGGCPMRVHPDHEVEMAKWVRDKCLSFATKCGVQFSPGTRLPNIAAYQRRRKG